MIYLVQLGVTKHNGKSQTYTAIPSFFIDSGMTFGATDLDAVKKIAAATVNPFSDPNLEIHYQVIAQWDHNTGRTIDAPQPQAGR